MNTNVLRAVFTRNFVAYFANPTGYVFICVFVLLSSIAAFWPVEFFNSNLANLDQLSFGQANLMGSFPFIMLVFIPAITMSIWAEERRQGTDELLLTIPAGDFEIVLGKYLATIAIYTVALLFSLVCNFTVLKFLGNPDVGLFLANYVGYWLVGLAMLSIGMVASFLTANLTVGFILGALFNAPLVFAAAADAIPIPAWVREAVPQLELAIKEWSIGGRFADFGRGILSLSGLAYFVMIVVVMLYLSMVLIGRRHWARGHGSSVMTGHYVARTLALAVLAVTVVVFFSRFDLRPDVTSERLSSLSPKTIELLDNLELERPIHVEAFVSPEVPESYVQARINLLAMLQELRKLQGKGVMVRIHDTEQYSDEAARAEARFNIQARRIRTVERGIMDEEEIFMGVAFTCGMEKVILPFIDRGIPVEYELVRSISTVAQQKRRKIGIVQTDAQLYGQFNMQMMSASPNWPIVGELEKMYDVERVDPSGPITEEYDALLAVQPSSLGPEQMNHLVEAIRTGMPTAIFEDPFPGFPQNVPGTSAPRRPPGGMNPMMQRQAPPQKGDIARLWKLLGVNFTADQIVAQHYNPFPKVPFDPEFVFVDRTLQGATPFDKEEGISSKLEMLLFPFPGSFSERHATKLSVKPLVRTGTDAGTVRYGEMLEMSMMGPPRLSPNRRMTPGNMSYILAAHITGPAPSEEELGPPAAMPSGHPGGFPGGMPPGMHPGMRGEEGDLGEAGETGRDAVVDVGELLAPADEEETEAATSEETRINVVLVSDIDMIHGGFFQLREQLPAQEMGMRMDFDNVTFVLNILDVLAGDDTFVEIRNRRPRHRTLERVDERKKAAEKATTEIRNKRQDELSEKRDALQADVDTKMKKLQQEWGKKEVDPIEVLQRMALAQNDANRRMAVQIQRLQQKQEREIKEVERKEDAAIRQVQDRYKMWAVVLPPIPPLLMGLIVFFTRRSREREGVARSRLR